MTDFLTAKPDTNAPPTGQDLYCDMRQAARLPNVRTDKPATIVAWDPRLAFDIAMAGVDKAMGVFEKYGLDATTAIELLQNGVFQKQLKDYAAEIESSGLSYRMKARILAEDLLPHAYDLASDSAYPAAVRADMIQWMTKVADLEPAKSNGKDVPQTGGFNFQIVFSGERVVGLSGDGVTGNPVGQSAVGTTAREPVVIEQRA